jgi:hypothetical protein
MFIMCVLTLEEVEWMNVGVPIESDNPNNTLPFNPQTLKLLRIFLIEFSEETNL